MKTKATLRDYVEKRNGVALGHRDLLKNMLKRSFGAGSFRGFWRNWNPIWGYYLSRKVMKPLSQTLPVELAIIITFLVSGTLHDLVISLVKQEPYFFFSTWFTIMGLIMLLEKKLKPSYRSKPWSINAVTNLTIIILCLWGADFLTQIYR